MPPGGRCMAEDGQIKILLVDDHAVVREGLRTYPDVVLMDLLMPEMDGITATKAIKEFDPDVKIIVLTSFQDDEHIMPAIEAGATGYLLKDVSAPELVKAIEGAFEGQAQLHPEVARKLMEQVRQPRRRSDPAEELTPRERDVLGLIA